MVFQNEYLAQCRKKYFGSSIYHEQIAIKFYSHHLIGRKQISNYTNKLIGRIILAGSNKVWKMSDFFPFVWKLVDRLIRQRHNKSH